MKSSLSIQKDLCRKRLRRALDRIPNTARRAKSSKITKKLLELPSFKNARRILVYLALPKEVRTMPFVRRALQLGKEVYAPVVEGLKKSIRVARVPYPVRNLKKGAYGIMEPKLRKRDRKRVPEFDIIIVPGIGFDRQGGRLGRGAGYFDRFLKKTGKALKIGIAFSEQIVEKVPLSANDVRMDLVITDRLEP